MPVERILDAVAADASDAARLALVELVGACVITTADGAITHANEAVGQLLRVPTSRVIGKPLQIFAPLEHRPALRRAIREVAHEPRGKTFVTRLERRGGVPFDAEARAAPIGGGARGALAFSFRDVTQAVQTEERLWELNTELETRIAERTAELELLTAELDRRRSYLETI